MVRTWDVRRDGTVIQTGVTEQTTMTHTDNPGPGTYVYGVRAVEDGLEHGWVDADPLTIAAPSGITTLGLHTTDAELTIWRDRWANGSADTFVNARISDEKTRVTNNRNTFNSNPSAHVWEYNAPNTGEDGSIAASRPSDWLPTEFSKAARLRDAAFHALVNEDAAVMGQVGSIIRSQCDEPTTDFTNTTRFNSGVNQLENDTQPAFRLAHATTVQLHAYDYFNIAVDAGLVVDLSAADKATIKTWFKAAADWMYPRAMEGRANWGFVNRPGNNYNLTSTAETAVWSDNSYRLRSTGGSLGPQIHTVNERFGNRASSCARWVTLYGVAFNEAFYRDMGWKWFRDWIRYALFPDGMLSDWFRWDNWPGYSTLHMTHAVTAIDALARNSKSQNLYDYETTNGAKNSAGTPSTDPSKSMLFAVQTFARYAKGTHDRYTSDHKMDFRNNQAGAGNQGFHDRFIPANLYYQDTGHSRDWYRGENGVHPWRVTANGGSDLNDAWAFAAPYLMWAGLEGQVNPYPTGA